MQPELENIKTLLLLLKQIDNSENVQKTGCLKTRKPKIRNSNKEGILTRNQFDNLQKRRTHKNRQGFALAET